MTSNLFVVGTDLSRRFKEPFSDLRHQSQIHEKTTILLSVFRVSDTGARAKASLKKHLAYRILFLIWIPAQDAGYLNSEVEGDLRRIPLSRQFQPLSTGITEHESALERDFVTLTRFLDAGATVTSQPTTIRFQHAGDRRRYPNRDECPISARRYPKLGTPTSFLASLSPKSAYRMLTGASDLVDLFY